MNLSDLAAQLIALGCPREKSAEMAAQLDKRAKQLAEQKQRSYDEALAHLLNLMSQGWAAQGGANSQVAEQPSKPSSQMIKPWKQIGSRPLGDFRIFTLRSDRKVSPRTAQEHDFYVLESANWVNVIALTSDRQLVMVEQYRHGSNTVELEIPGGIVDAADASPEATGVRELREETGYEGQQARLIGRIFPNPAIMNNVCFTILIENCRCVHPVEFDQGEDLITRLVPVSEVPQLVASGKIQHSLVAVALYHFELWQRGLKPDCK